MFRNECSTKSGKMTNVRLFVLFLVALLAVTTLPACLSANSLFATEPGDSAIAATVQAAVEATVVVAVEATLEARNFSPPGQREGQSDNDNFTQTGSQDSAPIHQNESSLPQEDVDLAQYLATNTRHFIGDPNAPVVMIEFSDFL